MNALKQGKEHNNWLFHYYMTKQIVGSYSHTINIIWFKLY